MDEQIRAEVLWVYSITYEKILERLVKKERVAEKIENGVIALIRSLHY